MKIWKQIAGSGGCFRAGTQVQLEGGKTKSIELLKEGDEILAFGELGELHLRVSLSKDGKRQTRRVHRLALEAFVGPCSEGMEACHGPAGASDESG